MSDFFYRTIAITREVLSGRSLLKLLLVFVAYFFTAKWGLEFNAVSGFATLVWPPTGIALASLLVFGYRYWPAIFLAAFSINLVTGAVPVIALGIAMGNTLEAIVGAFLLKRFGFDLGLGRVQDSLRYIFFGGVVATLVSATIGVSSLWLGGVVALFDYPATWIAWWIGDMLGALIVGYLLLNIRKLFLQRKHLHLRIFEVTAFVVTLLFFGAAIFLNFLDFLGQQSALASLVYLTSPLLIWAALRFGTIGSAFAIFAVSAMAIFGTALGKGPFASGETLSYNLLILQIFMGSVAATTMVLATAVGERTPPVTNRGEANHSSRVQMPASMSMGKKGSWIKKPHKLPIFVELSLILCGFLIITGVLLSLNYFGMQTLSSIRAYVGGEGLWSKAQKDGAYQLHVYALSRDESDFEKYQDLMAIPLGDRKARLELEKSDADLDRADQGFLEGGNHPDDARNMSLLFQRFRHVSYMERAIAIWTEGDVQIDRLMSLADALHEKITSGTATDEEIMSILRDIDDTNTGLTALENDFSFTLGEAARWLTGLLILSMLVVAALLIIPGLAVSYFIIRNIAKLDRAKTEFISLTSHQLRTPPTGIKWYAGMLLDGDVGPINPAQRKYVEQIVYNSQRMIDVVDTVLDISQIELGVFQNEPVPTDVCALIDRVLAELDFQLKDKELKLARRLECGSEPILIDPTLVRIVIQNLLINAIKYTPRGGEITLRAEIKDAELVITVGDTGRGIPKQDIPNIFKKFFRASNARGPEFQGIGLGLYVVKRILGQIGGTIDFSSEVGSGTRFSVFIPITPKDTNSTQE